MNYEEKNNEILEWARKNKARLNGVPIEEVLPELAESEDERIRKEIVSIVQSYRDSCISEGTHRFDDCLAWLEKQKHTAPNEYDEKMRKKIIDHLESIKMGCVICTIDTSEEIAWLERQKERKPAESISQLTVQGKGVYKICPRCKERMVRDDSMVYTSMPPQYRYECPKCGESECDTVMYDNPEMEEQKPAEWSEEDADILNCCISSIEEAKENRYAYKETDGDTSYDREIAWLKSLRPHWKPSEEQMKALERASTNEYLSAKQFDILVSLYEQLKKL